MAVTAWCQGAFNRFCRCAALGPIVAWLHVRYFNVPDIRTVEGGLLIASNHQSFFDPVLVGVGLARPTRYMARRSLFRIPGLGALIWAVGTFPVTQGAVDTEALRTAIRLLRDGEALVVFPEGTRTSDGSLGRFKPGVASMAIRCGVPVLPVCVEGAFACWPRTRLLPRPGRVAVAYGELLSPHGKSARELTRLLYGEVARLQGFLRDYLGDRRDRVARA